MSFEDVHHEHNFDLMVLEDVMKDFFVSFKCIKLAATIFFMNLCMVHGVNNKFLDELFALLRHHLFLEPNCLATNYYATRALTQKLRLDNENIYACPKDVSCFEGSIETMSLVPNMGVQQGCGKLGVACESPLIPRLQRLFRTPIVSKLMLCHSQNSSLDGLFIHLCDSKAWKHIQQKFPNFVVDLQNVHLALVVDGVNPFKLTHSTWSTWHVMLLNYNLPP